MNFSPQLPKAHAVNRLIGFSPVAMLSAIHFNLQLVLPIQYHCCLYPNLIRWIFITIRKIARWWRRSYTRRGCQRRTWSSRIHPLRCYYSPGSRPHASGSRWGSRFSLHGLKTAKLTEKGKSNENDSQTILVRPVLLDLHRPVAHI